MPHNCFIGRAAFVLVDTSLSHITYQFVITNANNTSVRDKPFVKCKFHRPCIVTQESARSYDMGGCMMKAFPC